MDSGSNLIFLPAQDDNFANTRSRPNLNTSRREFCIIDLGVFHTFAKTCISSP